jgi:hypothetical protein
VASIDDFYLVRFLYRLSHDGEAVESALATFAQALRRRGELQSVALEDIHARLETLIALASGSVPDAAKVYEVLRDLVRVFEDLAENAQAFMAGIVRSVEIQQANVGAVVDFKKQLVDYLERFIGDLVSRSGVITQRIKALDPRIDALLWQAANREARDIAPGDVHEQADEFEDAAARCLDADFAVEHQGDLLVGAWQEHFDHLEQLRPTQPDATLDALAEWITDMAGDNPARAALHAAQNAASERFVRRAAAIGLREKELTEEKAALSLEWQRLEQGEDAVPPAPYDENLRTAHLTAVACAHAFEVAEASLRQADARLTDAGQRLAEAHARLACALGLTVPLFAAVASHYNYGGHGGYAGAPRLVLLDEAFAGIDREARAHCMALIHEFDLDFVMTNESEWGCYAELPGVLICHLQRREGIDAVHVSRWAWDGRTRREETDPERRFPAEPGI